MKSKHKVYNFLRWSQKYTQTDMVYLAKGAGWLTLGEIVSSTSGFLLAIAFANLLPKETYGTYRYVLSLASILAIPTLSGMNTAIIRAVARGYEGSFIPALKTRLRWGILSSLAGLGLAGYYFFQNNVTLTICFLIAAAFLPLMNSFTICGSFWKGKKRFDVLTKFNIVSQILCATALIATLFLTKNLFLILVVYFLSWTLGRFIFLQITIKKVNFSRKQDSETISYGKHLSLMGLFYQIANNSANIILWHFLGAGPLAIFSFAILPVHYIKTLFTNIFPIALPKFSQQSKQEIKATLLKKIAKFYLIIIPIIILYIIFSPFVYKIFFPKYLNAIFYSQIFAITIVFIPQTLLGISLQAQMRKKELYILSIFSPLSTIITLLIFIPLYGIMGAILGSIIYQIFGFGLQLALFKKM